MRIFVVNFTVPFLTFVRSAINNRITNIGASMPFSVHRLIGIPASISFLIIFLFTDAIFLAHVCVCAACLSPNVPLHVAVSPAHSELMISCTLLVYTRAARRASHKIYLYIEWMRFGYTLTYIRKIIIK